VKRVLTPTGTTKSTTDALAITITLNDADLNFIKADTGLASTEATTYLAWTEDAATDVSENKVTPKKSGTAKKVADGKFTPDTTDPELDDFSINMNTGTVTLVFNEAVNANTFDETTITLQSAADGNAGGTKKIATLSAAKSKATIDVQTLSFVLAADDLDVLKFNEDFATADSNVFISHTNAMIKDMADTNARSVKEIGLGSGKVSKVGSYGADTTGPAVDSFTFNLNTGELVMSMSEPVGTTFDVTKITLIDDTGAATHTPTGGNGGTSAVRSGATGKIVTVTLSDDDLDFVKALPLLAVNDASTILTLTADFASDTSNRPIQPLAANDNKTPGAAGFGSDSDRPELTGYILDLRTNQLKLTFSETVNTDNVDLSGIKLLASQGAVDTDKVYQLTSTDVSCEP
jgi:hypothetical protein